MGRKISREEIHALRGSLKLNTGGKPFAGRMVELNRKEKTLEEARSARLPKWGSKSPG